MKQKVINAEYRKDSNSFPKWMKYEVTILNEDQTTETIPAYGKDLQDALSRVVHDKKAVKLEKQAKRIPSTVWVVLWFGYVLGLAELCMGSFENNSTRSIVFLSGFMFITGVVLWSKAWFRQRNLDKR